jgi:hypothetical protein
MNVARVRLFSHSSERMAEEPETFQVYATLSGEKGQEHDLFVPGVLIIVSIDGRTTDIPGFFGRFCSIPKNVAAACISFQISCGKLMAEEAQDHS